MSPKYLSIILAVLVLGCSHAQKPVCRVNKLNTTGIQEGEAIVVLSETKTFWGYHEGKIGKCISKAFKKQNKKIEIFPSDEFRRTFFSKLNLSDDYSTKEVFENIFKNKETLQHIEWLNIHYVVLTSLKTSYYINKDLDIVVYVQAKAGQDTYVSGEVFDIKQKCESGKIATSVGAEWTNRGLMHHIPIWVGRGGTESEACKAFGEEVVRFLIGQDTSE